MRTASSVNSGLDKKHFQTNAPPNYAVENIVTKEDMKGGGGLIHGPMRVFGALCWLVVRGTAVGRLRPALLQRGLNMGYIILYL